MWNTGCWRHLVALSTLVVCAGIGRTNAQTIPSPRAPDGFIGAEVHQPVSQSDAVLELERRVRALEASYGPGKGDPEGWKRVDIQTKPNFKINGRIFIDHIIYDSPLASPTGVDRMTETGFDTVRIGANGNVFENYKYKLEVEFEGTEVDYKDIYIEVNHLPHFGNLRVGHFKEPFALEELTSSRFLTWMERSVAYQTFVPQRNIGIMVYHGNDTFSWWAGVFRSGFDESPPASGSEISDPGDGTITARIAWLPYYDEVSGGRYLIHLGGGYSSRKTTLTSSFRNRPELGTQGGYLSTVTLPNGDRTYELVNIESAIVWGPVSLQAEFYGMGAGALGGETFDGGYVQLSYFLTGEHRGYKLSGKVFDRVRPLENAFWVDTVDGICTGRGAWELKFRWSYLDMISSTSTDGGYVDNTSVGLNWYLNPWTRLMFDWVYEDFAGGNGVSGNANNFAARFQIDF